MSRFSLFIALVTVLNQFTCLAVQETNTSETLIRLKTGSAQEIASTIKSLPDSLLEEPEIVRQLTLLLNDERAVIEQMMGRESVSERAWFRLLHLPASAVVTILQTIPELKSERARGRALEAICSIGKPDRQAYNLVLPYCRDADERVRSPAISALDSVADDSNESIVEFGVFLLDTAPNAKWSALDALEKRSEHIAILIPDIINLLDDDSDVYLAVSRDFMVAEKLKGRVARLLAKVGPGASEAVPKLETLMGPENNTNVRIWAATAICRISSSPPPETLGLLGQLLLDDLDHEFVQNEAPEAIKLLGTAGAPLLDSLERAKKHTSAQIRSGLVGAFFAIEPESAVSRCLSLMDDQDELVVTAVIEEFRARDISEPRVIAAYVRSLERHEERFDEPADSAVNALAKLESKAKEAVPALEKLAQDPNISDSLKDAVIDALKRIR